MNPLSRNPGSAPGDTLTLRPAKTQISVATGSVSRIKVITAPSMGGQRPIVFLCWTHVL